MRTTSPGCLLPLSLLSLVLAGCGVSDSGTTPVGGAPGPMQGAGISGHVHGGQQPVSGSTVQLYYAGTTGDGSAAHLLIGTTTGNDGSFTFTPGSYTCPSGSSQIYAIATGGNPGLAPSTNNLQLNMMTALGSCNTLSASSNIVINEITTVAAVWALANYMTDYLHVGSTSGHATALANAFTLAGEFVSTSNGTAPGTTLPAGYSSPASEINTLGDILSTCVNSAGGTGNGTACGTLFTAVTPYQGTAPTETIGAALLLAANPNQNVSAAFGLASPTAPFQPILSAAPADWTVLLLATGAKRILFVGDSFTHGRYLPARTYNNANVTDENYNINGPANSNNANRAETSSEPGPYGGIPGIFKMLTTEGASPVNYDVHIYTISSTSLANLYSYGTSVVANPQWDGVVLQELSYLPLPSSLSGNSNSHPQTFCNSVKTIEQGVHTANPAAKIYLYESWARADETQALATGGTTFAQAQSQITTSFHNVFYQAAAATNNANVFVAPAGDAWLSEINTGGSSMQQNPYGYSYSGGLSPFLWYLYQSGSNPSTSSSSPDYLHPSVYGAYLSALVLYEEVTGKDSTLLGSGESAAATLGISGAIAVQLQSVAHAQVAVAPSYTGNPCSVT